MWGHSKKAAFGERALPRNWVSQSLILDLPDSRAMWKKHVVFKPPSPWHLVRPAQADWDRDCTFRKSFPHWSFTEQNLMLWFLERKLPWFFLQCCVANSAKRKTGKQTNSGKSPLGSTAGSPDWLGFFLLFCFVFDSESVCPEAWLKCKVSVQSPWANVQEQNVVREEFEG